MKLRFYGHAAFRFDDSEGRRVLIDPYRSPDSGGLLPIAEGADLVVVSHENDRYHSHLGQVLPPFEVLRGLEIPEGGVEAIGLRFEAIPVYETADRRPEDKVTILHFSMDGLRIADLGDLGHPLTESELAPIRGTDLVLVPAGGPPTIAFEHVPELLDAIGPRVVIPMHYKTPGIGLDIRPIGEFLELLRGWEVDRPGRSTYEIMPGLLPDRPTVLVMEPARLPRI